MKLAFRLGNPCLSYGYCEWDLCPTNFWYKNFLAYVAPVLGRWLHADLCCISDVSEKILTFSIFKVALVGTAPSGRHAHRKTNQRKSPNNEITEFAVRLRKK